MPEKLSLILNEPTQIGTSYFEVTYLFISILTGYLLRFNTTKFMEY